MENTIGEKRVQVDLNEVKPGNTYALKTKAAEAINILEDFKNDERNQITQDQARLVAIAQTKFEEAAMWAVKAGTK